MKKLLYLDVDGLSNDTEKLRQ